MSDSEITLQNTPVGSVVAPDPQPTFSGVLASVERVRTDLSASIVDLRGVEKIDPVERRLLNGAIDDAAADLGRLQVAMQRLMERTQETTDAT